MDEPTISQPPVAHTPTKQSGFGVASIVMSLLGCSGMAFTFAACVALIALRPNAFTDKRAVHTAIGFLIIGMVLLELIALVFGLLGCRDRTRRRGLAVAGIVVAGLTLFVCLALIVLGRAA